MRCRNKVSLSRGLLIHHYRGPPSPTGEGFFICLKLKKLRRNSSAKSNLKNNAGTPANLAQIQTLGDQFTPRVILSGGRSPESNPQGDRRSGSPNVERTDPCTPFPPSCHPEREGEARSRTRRATAGRDLQTSSAQTPALHFRPRVILSGGRSPESNPEGDRRSGSPIVERTNPVLNFRNGKTIRQPLTISLA